jgi:hypothetical protein
MNDAIIIRSEVDKNVEFMNIEMREILGDDNIESPLIKLQVIQHNTNIQKRVSLLDILDNPSLVGDPDIPPVGLIEREKEIMLQISIQELIFDNKPC